MRSCWASEQQHPHGCVRARRRLHSREEIEAVEAGLRDERPAARRQRPDQELVERRLFSRNTDLLRAREAEGHRPLVRRRELAMRRVGAARRHDDQPGRQRGRPAGPARCPGIPPSTSAARSRRQPSVKAARPRPGSRTSPRRSGFRRSDTLTLGAPPPSRARGAPAHRTRAGARECGQSSGGVSARGFIGRRSERQSQRTSPPASCSDPTAAASGSARSIHAGGPRRTRRRRRAGRRGHERPGPEIGARKNAPGCRRGPTRIPSSSPRGRSHAPTPSRPRPQSASPARRRRAP